MIGTPDRDDPDLCDTIHRVALVHITEMQELPRAAGSKPTSAGEISSREWVE